VSVCQDAHPNPAEAAETPKRHQRRAAGAGGRLMLGNLEFRNKKLIVMRKNNENFRNITSFTEKR
jgi:hypothetical protein